jgi:hypothetical protein
MTPQLTPNFSPSQVNPSMNEFPSISITVPAPVSVISPTSGDSLRSPFPLPNAGASSVGIELETGSNSGVFVQPTTRSSPSSAPSALHSITSTSEDVVVSCSGTNLQRPETIFFIYSLETQVKGAEAIENVRKATEKALNRDIANLLLPCDIDEVQADSVLGFEGIDYVPEDSIAEEGKSISRTLLEMSNNRS